MNHSLEAHVDLAAADDLGYAGWVVRLQDSHFEAFVFEVASRLCEVYGDVIGRCVLEKNPFSY